MSKYKIASPLKDRREADAQHSAAYDMGANSVEHKSLHDVPDYTKSTEKGDNINISIDDIKSQDKDLTLRETNIIMFPSEHLPGEESFLKKDGEEREVTGTSISKAALSKESVPIDKTDPLLLLDRDEQIVITRNKGPIKVIEVEPTNGNLLPIGAVSPFTWIGTYEGVSVGRTKRVAAENIFKEFLITQTNAQYDFKNYWDETVEELWYTYKDDFMKSDLWKEIDPDVREAFSSNNLYIPKEFDFTSNNTRSDFRFRGDRARIFELNDFNTYQKSETVLHAGQVSPYVLAETYNIPVEDIKAGHYDFVYYQFQQAPLGEDGQPLTGKALSDHDDRVKEG